MTHRDQINNMSNEELAYKIYILGYNPFACKDACIEKGNCYTGKRCIDNIIEWLNMEVEE